MIKYRILTDHRLVLLSLQGSATAEEILEASLALRKDAAFDETYDTLVDNRGLTTPLWASELGSLAEPHEQYMDLRIRVAVVASDDAVYGTSRMHQQLTEFRSPSQIGVFRDLESALEWLGRSGPGIAEACEELSRAE